MVKFYTTIFCCLFFAGSCIAQNPNITQFTPALACAGSGAVITLTGTNFAGATAVRFNGVVATSFTVVNATSITAVLPATATTGVISITTSAGTGTTGSSFTVKPSPVIKIAAGYCTPFAPAGKIRIIATADISVGNTWAWSYNLPGNNTTTISYVDVDIAGKYTVTANASGCQAAANIGVAQELVINGDFDLGNVGFTTPSLVNGNKYKYAADTLSVNNELQGEGLYGVDTNAHNFHTNFWGRGHTAGGGRFMIINGFPNGVPQPIAWQETVAVLPNTDYYFSAWGMSLNNATPFAQLQFNVNDVQVGSNPTLPTGSNDNANNGWQRFYGIWPSGTNTSAKISITDLQTATGGNDFGLDDISFATLAPFINLTSAVGTDNPLAFCLGGSIPPISYEIGSDGSEPALPNLPPGLTTTWDGRNIKISGIPSLRGTYDYSVTTTGCINKTTTGKIIVDASVSGTFPAAIVSTCFNQPATVILNGNVGNVKKWMSSSDGGITWNDSAKTTTSLAVSSVTNAALYKAIVQYGTCKADTSAIVKVGVRNLWTGETSANWNNIKNWSDETLPTVSLCDNVIIPAVTFPKVYPVLNSDTVAIKNLIINSTASLTVTGPASLRIAGIITNNGSLDARNGTLDFNGTTAQAIAGNLFVDSTIKNLTLSNSSGLTISNTPLNLLKITGTLRFGHIGNATLHTGDNIVLVSTATATARVADITNGGIDLGNQFDGYVTTERYFPQRRAWRLFTAPLYDGGTIFNTWQNGGVFTKGRGTYVSGAGATSPIGINGLDWSPYNNSSLIAGSTFTPVTNTKTNSISKGASTTSAANNAYFIFVRGDRLLSNTNIANMNITTLSSRGRLQTGNQAFTAGSAAASYTMLGNPYASPVDLGKMERNNVANNFWVWDPYLNTEQGGYVVINIDFNSSTYASIPNSGMTQMLQSGQAFFVQTIAAGAASVVFKETAKYSGSSTVAAFRPLAQLPSFRANLYHLNANDQTVLLDGILAQYDDDFSMEVDIADALKSSNVKEMLAIRRNTKTLTLDKRPLLRADDTLYLELTRTTQRNYRFVFEPLNLDPVLTAFIDDSYTGIKTPVSVTDSSVFDFVINGVAASAAAGRFRIVFKKNSVLPVTFKNIRAYQQAADIAVTWDVENEINISRYEVEKSADGINFVKVNTAPAKGANNIGTAYNWLDEHPVGGNNFYRIRSISHDGSIEYSTVVVVKMGKPTPAISIYPNPVKNGVIGVEFKNMAAGVYQARLLNPIGQIIFSKSVTHTTGVSLHTITTGSKLSSGVYQLEITASDNEINTVKVVIL